MSAVTNKIVLVGFMGTGKSTVSRLLADELGWQRIDSDEEIVRREGRTVASIFEEHGEAGFRQIESEVIASIMNAPEPAVVATGGGAPLAAANREAMLAGGYVVALKADAAHIISRVKADTARPLLAGDAESRVPLLLEQRKTLYDFAHHMIDTTELTAEEVAALIVKGWNETR
ncbi:shikimate kinase [Paenibacillus protaetiae]|uniref:Shikimate kinase n=1 Tax=Paenibacillus protaetiae TaxID=2509456 RepID=A0A4P6ERH5_9BACL|nr:shikimate kinase [Paenibacillus protaetiae]QAY65474.1 shikimate kinase [Paenibacillus protaetiae]